MLRFFRVSGDSLSPEYREGDYVLAFKVPFRSPRLRPGDVVVFRTAGLGVLIKRIASVSSDGREAAVRGTHPLSTDSGTLGPVRAEQVIGRVIWHIRKPR